MESSSEDLLAYVENDDGAVQIMKEKGRVSADTDDEDNEEAEEEDLEDDDDLPGEETLRQVANRACKRIDIGCAILPDPLFRPDVQDYDGSDELRDAASSLETPYARTVRSEFNAVVIEHHLKWTPLCVSEPGPLPDGAPSDRLGRYDFDRVDRMVDWALANDLTVKGHVLVWHVTSPKTLLEAMEPDQVRNELKRHIFTTIGHFRGRIRTWDVVNEALAPDGSLADTVFLRKLGPSYIEDAFRWAHEADPTAILLYNDNKVEGFGTPKAQGFYELLADLKAKGVPVHGCGMQAHWNAAGVGRNRCPTPRMLQKQIRRLGDLGLTVNLSEMDVRVSQLDAPLRNTAQRQIYHDLCAAALSEPACNGIWLWGFTDRHTWVTHFYYDDEPLIFDEDYQKKPAYWGLRDAIASLAPGGMVGGNACLWLGSDSDEQGRPWGHEWTKPEPASVNNESVGGDARPDWEQGESAPDHELS